MSRVPVIYRWLQVVAVFAMAAVLGGCAAHQAQKSFTDDKDLTHYQSVATKIEYPDVNCPTRDVPEAIPSPLTIGKDDTPEFWDLKLEEAVQTSLAKSKVLNELGGLVLRQPNTARTIHNPSIVETDPRFGVEGALSAFDAQLTARAFFEHNDRALNNIFLGGGTRLLQQDTEVYQTQISKRTATGALLAIRNNTDYDANNSPGNQFYSAWNTNYEVEARQPLLQGGGADFNRIAGPLGIPGFLNGVMIARVNTDISLAEFEMGLRDLVSNVENTYWDLYFAYRDLDARIKARDAALETWRRIQALYAAGRRGGEAEKEAEAREQYFRFQEEVQNAWSGRMVDGTRTGNGSSGGTARSGGGVRVVERRLRLLMGVTISDARLIRPADEPRLAKVLFDWQEILPEAFARRAELRRQKWMIKKREMELVASRNFLLPNLDTVGRYRFRGFGDDLLNPTQQPGRFDNAYQNLTNGDFQEWQLGAEFSMAIGNRRGHAAVRNAQLNLSRERAILEQQEREIGYDLSNAVGDVDRSYDVAQTNFNRRVAARQHLDAVQAAYDADKAPLDLLLEAQRRMAEADTRYFGALVEYALAVKNVHFEKGSLLDYNEIYLAEGPWPGKAYDDAAERAARTREAGPLSYIFSKQPVISAGTTPPPVTMQSPAEPLPPVLPGQPVQGQPMQTQPLPVPAPPEAHPPTSLPTDAPAANPFSTLPPLEGVKSTEQAQASEVPQPIYGMRTIDATPATSSTAQPYGAYQARGTQPMNEARPKVEAAAAIEVLPTQATSRADGVSPTQTKSPKQSTSSAPAKLPMGGLRSIFRAHSEESATPRKVAPPVNGSTVLGSARPWNNSQARTGKRSRSQSANNSYPGDTRSEHAVSMDSVHALGSSPASSEIPASYVSPASSESPTSSDELELDRVPAGGSETEPESFRVPSVTPEIDTSAEQLDSVKREAPAWNAAPVPGELPATDSSAATGDIRVIKSSPVSNDLDATTTLPVTRGGHALESVRAMVSPAPQNPGSQAGQLPTLQPLAGPPAEPDLSSPPVQMEAAPATRASATTPVLEEFSDVERLPTP